ncbi:N-acetylmuramic acid 6-phosphate etherase [Spiroplasma sabaudiense Ar-1343]|uniref:N-acetylmuramic acid 6-phosphate etherase n=1 Tax=Spiroplasma sabaudiense Ar-1343 TaxID=1276257 RepID=W6AB59_9MOLU|nr:N-acetylmuramic acid 6-phosphate etherase [Spiroplasma sabaudiense]AHI54282.1 N-acetylmuramic acid 6-phosphate etherase [Spiroplasma sabaudiense Ar-1343]
MKDINLKNILTEGRNPNSRDLDTKSTLQLLEIINQEDSKITSAIAAEMKTISQAVDLIYEKIKNEGRLIYLGAGSSGRIGVLDASEMLPTYGVGDKIFGYVAGGDEALRIPIEGAEDSQELAIQDLKAINFSKKDVVLGIGASGRTPYVLGALKYAKSINATAIALCMTSNSEFKEVADLTMAVLTGPEVVTGSTRMKSGTATKMVLNMISTTLMIKFGKVYDNLMVDVKATNEKLVARCIKIVQDLTNVSDDEKVLATLKQAEMDCKFAAIMLKNDVSLQKAKEMYQSNNNSLRNII